MQNKSKMLITMVPDAETTWPYTGHGGPPLVSLFFGRSLVTTPLTGMTLTHSVDDNPYNVYVMS